MNSSAGVEIRGVHKRFGETVALEDITLEFPAGSFVVLLGPSGSGKTTLLNILGGFLGPTSGEVRIGGESVLHLPPAERPTATVFQDYALFPHMNVMNNVAFGLAMQGIAKAERRERTADMLELVGLAGFGKRSVHELSGGQKQRVALARSLVTEPQVLLLDEPLGALDLNLRKQMQRELITIQTRVGTTFIHVTHDQEEALSLADLVVLMNAGKVEDVGAPKRLYLEPATRFARNVPDVAAVERLNEGLFNQGDAVAFGLEAIPLVSRGAFHEVSLARPTRRGDARRLRESHQGCSAKS